jgi:hypothetical protein
MGLLLRWLGVAGIVVAASEARADDRVEIIPAPRAGEPTVSIDNCLGGQGVAHCFSTLHVPASYADSLRARRAGPEGSGALRCDGARAAADGDSPPGVTPPTYAQLYNLPTTAIGAGKVVAIVDACSDPTIVSDVQAYRAQFGLAQLPECGGADGNAPTPGDPNPCIGVVSQRGDDNLGPSDSKWGAEIALDVDMVSAACPECSIVLVEADSPNWSDLTAAVTRAVSFGPNAVSNSYGAPEDNDAYNASFYENPGILFTVASGDSYYDNEAVLPSDNAQLVPNFPSSVPTVLSVGGTDVRPSATSPRGYEETPWGQGSFGTTSGCSSEFTKPTYQNPLDQGTCVMRADVDVAAYAGDIAIYVGGGWTSVGGTSAAAPFVAGVLTRVGLSDRSNAFFYSHGAQLSFFDVTEGTNDPLGVCTDVMCTAGKGWDGPTGWGTPNGDALAALAASSAPSGGTEPVGGGDAGAGEGGASEKHPTTDLDAGSPLAANDASTLSNEGNSGVGLTANADAGTGSGESAAGSAPSVPSYAQPQGCGCVAAGATVQAPLPAVAGVALGFAFVRVRRRRSRRTGS